MKRIITHKGPAHNDDLLAVGFALALEGVCPVYRRDPTPHELIDPDVLVLDVGGQHVPHLRNYDHHQFPRDALSSCALYLYLGEKAPELSANLSKFTKWYDALREIDSKGPFAWAKKNNLPEFPFGLIEGVEAPIKELFEQYSGDTPVSDDIVRLLKSIAEVHIKNVNKKAEAYATLAANAEIMQLETVKGIIYLSKDISVLQQYRDALLSKGTELGWSITLDDRGEGLTLYRFNDHPHIDFSKIAKEKGIIFAHAGGFVAKTADKNLDNAKALVMKSINPWVDSPKPEEE